jgi:Transcription elongation factor, GreA/GreB, C-term
MQRKFMPQRENRSILIGCIMAKLASKESLRAELIAGVEADLAAAMQAQKTTREGATHEQAKPENDKDTRALEQSYLARGQAKRVDELTTSLQNAVNMKVRPFGESDPIALSALIDVEEDGESRILFMCPSGGGSMLSGGVVVTTPESPLGRALLGKTAGDVVETQIAGKQRELAISKVR